MGEKDKGSVVATSGTSKEAQSLFDIIRRLEQYSIVEKVSADIPEEMITTVGQLHFLEIILKHGFLSTLPLLVTAPLGLGVMQKTLPVFGKDTISLSDKIFAFALTALPALATVLFVSLIFSVVYHGSIVRTIKARIIEGILIGKGFGTFMCFAVFHIVYYKVIKVQTTYTWIYKIFGPEKGKTVSTLVWNIGSVLPDAAWYTVILFLLSIAILWLSSKFGQVRTNHYRELTQKWGLV